MSFFFKSEKEENLQYDDTAFIHFAISLCAVVVVIFIYFVWMDIRDHRSREKSKIARMKGFRKKI